MGLFGKNTETVTTEIPVKEEPVKIVLPSGTVVGSSTVFTGDFKTEEPLTINGSVNGDIDSTESVTISLGGVHSGTANVQNITIDGLAESSIDCKGLTKISATGVLKGRLRSAQLLTDVGSQLEGDIQLKMAGSDAKAEEAAAAVDELFKEEA